MPTLRRNIESASLPVITWLNGLPRALPFLAILALMVAGILVPGWGWVLLLVVVLFLVWTFYLSWPALDGVNKLDARHGHRPRHRDHHHPGHSQVLSPPALG